MGPYVPNSESNARTDSPSARTNTEPVCRSPCSRLCVLSWNRCLARPISRTNARSARSSRTSSSFAGSHPLCSWSTYGSVNTRSSVISLSSGFVAAAIARRRSGPGVPNTLVAKPTAPTYSPSCAAAYVCSRPAMSSPRHTA